MSTYANVQLCKCTPMQNYSTRHPCKTSVMLAYFGNLPASLSTPTLQQLLSLCGGPLESFKRPTDSFALVEFGTAVAVRRAKALFGGLCVEGRELCVRVEEEDAGSKQRNTDADADAEDDAEREEGELPQSSTSDDDDDDDRETEATLRAKRREVERILQQKRLSYEWKSVKRPQNQQRPTTGKRASTVNESALRESLRRMASALRDACERDAEREQRHARDTAAVREEMLAAVASGSASPLQLPQCSDLAEAFAVTGVPERFVRDRPEARRKEAEIFQSQLQARRERLTCLPCGYHELLELNRVRGEAQGSEAAVLVAGVAACRRLGLSERLARLAADCLVSASANSSDPLEQLLSEPTFVMEAKGPVQGECLLACMMRMRLMLEWQ